MAKVLPGSDVGTGGMATKLTAAKIATLSGADMVIANGADDRGLERIRFYIISLMMISSGTILKPHFNDRHYESLSVDKILELKDKLSLEDAFEQKLAKNDNPVQNKALRNVKDSITLADLLNGCIYKRNIRRMRLSRHWLRPWVIAGGCSSDLFVH